MKKSHNYLRTVTMIACMFFTSQLAIAIDFIKSNDENVGISLDFVFDNFYQVSNDPPIAKCKNITISGDNSCTASIIAAHIDDGSNDPNGDPLTFSLNNYGPFILGSHTIILYVYDGEYTSTCSATVTVRDDNAPTALCKDLTIALNANGQANITPSMINNGSFDNCTADGNLVLSLSQNSFDCDDIINTIDTSIWQDVGIPSFSAGEANYQSLAIHNGEPYVAYYDAANGGKATVMKFNGSGWLNVGVAGFSTSYSHYHCLVFNNGVPYVAFYDSDKFGKATVMKFDGNNWVNVGSSGFTPGAVGTISLAFNNGNPHVAFIDGANTNKTSVMKYNGMNWVNVGIAGFSSSSSHFQSLAFHNNQPYVAFRDDGNGTRTTVMKFNGTNWVNVGNAGFSAGIAHSQSLVFYNNEPYVAYQDGGNGNRATVMKFNGSSWINVGNAGFSAGFSYFQSLAFFNGKPYVAYVDEAFGRRTTLMKFNGTNWVNVGSLGFSAGGAFYTSLAFDNDVPYVAYRDDTNGKKTSVMKFDSPTNMTTLTVTDEAGNFSNCTASITVQDNTDPITPTLADVTDECSATAILPTTTDNCKGTITGTTSDPLTYNIQGTHVIHWTFDDDNGNSLVVNQNVVIDDLSAPEISIDCPSDIALCQPQNVSWIEPAALDNCSGIIVSKSHWPGDYFDEGTTLVEYNFEDSKANVISCSFNIVIGTLDVSISQSILPDFCQGISLLEVIIPNENNLLMPITYEWSDNLGNDSTAVAFTNGTYSVTVLDGNNCEAVAVTIVEEEESNLLSSYVLLANLEVKTKRSIISGGGVGVYGDGMKARILRSSMVNTFVKAPIVKVRTGSNVSRKLIGRVNLDLPDFISNPSNCENNIIVQAGETVLLTGNNYGKITIKEDGLLIVNSPEWYVNEILMQTYSEIVFEQPTIVLVKTKMILRKNVIVNIENEALRFYIAQNIEVNEGSDFSGNVYAKGKIYARQARNNNQTYMQGTFISEDIIQSDDFVNWDWMTSCNDDQIVSDPSNCNSDDLKVLNNEFEKSDNELINDSNESQIIIALSPNPTPGPFELDMTLFIGQDIEINIYNILGKRVISYKEIGLKTGKVSFDLSNHIGSNYQIEIIINGKEKITKRMVVTHP